MALFLRVLFDDFNKYLVHAGNYFVERNNFDMFNEIPDQFSRIASVRILNTQFIPAPILFVTENIVFAGKHVTMNIQFSAIGNIVNIGFVFFPDLLRRSVEDFSRFVN
jgi:hypothetical protein